ncbi:GSCFA domain protein [Parabacteroides sp. 52]|uniref:GSCFA domain-containing protein n=1 Tax=unclassified Parabacteroides TaxID=2649774 RepID=UPI0013D77B36|nr:MULTISPECIES: GSCFA domain-containing protein [unclassified Parabacteroides]MDH6534142.1 hypothetical protein [Parabacteroides sp. PM5-20]NDV54955.1 GSCFA domain protein [Parabacteroides sp. 52]
MDLYTPIHIPPASFPFSYADRILLLGSCFAENIGERLNENKFPVDVNPLGIVYNPASVAQALQRLIRPEEFVAADLFAYQGGYHSFMHHSRFSAPSQEEALEQMNKRLTDSAQELLQINRLVVTWGTACVYRLKENGRIVSNCHKLPEKMFDRQMLTVDEIVAQWKELLLSLWAYNGRIKLVFTVSPIRHWKDGAHGNQLSKATLLLAIHHLQQAFPERVAYFPAYEILLDELRDYRYYADDMLHPSPLAIDYIWERFAEVYFSAETQKGMKDWQEIRKAVNHKPFQVESEGHQQFIRQTLLKLEQLHRKMPSFDIEKEKRLLQSKLL